MANPNAHSDDRQRDLRIDFVRGIALLVLYSDHIRGNVVSEYTPMAIGLSDMADVFVFLSGYSCGLSYGRRLQECGLWACCRRAWFRAGQVYFAKLFMTAISLAFMLPTAKWVTPYFFGVAWNLDLVRNYPIETMVEAQLFRLELYQYFVLALYIPFLIFVPIILLGLQKRPRMVIVGSALLYAAVQFLPDLVTLPEPWRKALFFNPFAWQFLFFSACALGQKTLATRVCWQPGFPLVLVALIILVGGVVLHCFATIPPHRLTDKPNLGVIRLAHFVAVLVAGLWFVPGSKALSRCAILRPILVCGRYPLIGYCGGGFLAILGEASLNAFSTAWPMPFIVNIVGWAGCLTATAIWDLTWKARHPRFKPVSVIAAAIRT